LLAINDRVDAEVTVLSTNRWLEVQELTILLKPRSGGLNLIVTVVYLTSKAREPEYNKFVQNVLKRRKSDDFKDANYLLIGDFNCPKNFHED
jgi:hypothetical protein